MSLAVVFSRARTGIEAPLVTVEVHLSGGLPAFSIVGLRRNRSEGGQGPRSQCHHDPQFRVPATNASR